MAQQEAHWVLLPDCVQRSVWEMLQSRTVEKEPDVKLFNSFHTNQTTLR